MELSSLTSTCMNKVDCKIIGTVFNFKLVEQNSQHLRGRHAAVDAHVCHRAVGRSKHCSLRKLNKNIDLITDI